MSAQPEATPSRPPRHDTPAKDTASIVLLGIAMILGVIEIFYRPFGLGPPAFLCALIAISISAKHRRLGLYTTLGITVAWVVGAAICVWQSNPLY